MALESDTPKPLTAVSSTTGITANTDLKINRGTIQVYRVFDIAEEIDLRKVEQILSQQRGGETRLRLAKAGQAVVMRNAPIRMSLGEVELKLTKGTYRADTMVTVFDYGVVSISFLIPIAPGTPW